MTYTEKMMLLSSINRVKMIILHRSVSNFIVQEDSRANISHGLQMMAIQFVLCTI